MWLFLVVDARDIVVAGDWQDIQDEHDEQFRFTAAQYHEMASISEGALFLENKLGLESHRYEVFDRLHAGAHIFVIGHSGLLTGIDCALERVAYEKGDQLQGVHVPVEDKRALASRACRSLSHASARAQAPASPAHTMPATSTSAWSPNAFGGADDLWPFPSIIDRPHPVPVCQFGHP